MVNVSVIMPTYKNDGFSLRRAIKSVINQTYNNWELIIIDDNKEENYSKIVEKIVCELEDSRITYIKNENNLGSAKTRNRGIKFARGKYITFLDDDDEYLPRKVESQFNLMIKKNADYSLTDLDLFDDNNKLVRKRRHTYIKENSKLLNLHLKYHLTGTDTFMFKKDYLIQIGMFDEIDMGDEFYLMLKAIQSNGTFVYQPECFVKAYVHTSGTGITAGANKEMGENLLFENKRKYFNILNSNDVRYIKMRHYLVLLSCGLRDRNIYKILKNLIYSFFSCPLSFVKFSLNRKEY